MSRAIRALFNGLLLALAFAWAQAQTAQPSPSATGAPAGASAAAAAASTQSPSDVVQAAAQGMLNDLDKDRAGYKLSLIHI